MDMGVGCGKQTGKSEEIRVAGLHIIRAVGRAGAAALWLVGGAPYEEIFKLVLQNLSDPSAVSMPSLTFHQRDIDVLLSPFGTPAAKRLVNWWLS